MAAKNPYISEETWRYFWHPVCTLDEFHQANASGKGPMAVTLLDEELVLVDFDNKIEALRNRCAHRSSRLSLGKVEGHGLRCPYHGWVYNGDGVCIEIPSCPKDPIPTSAKIDAFEVKIQYDLIWVRLDLSADTEVPDFPSWDDKTMRVCPGEPYTWATSAARRLENYTDLSHFPFIHDKSLGDSSFTEAPIADIDRIEGELRFTFYPPEGLDIPNIALMGTTSYRIFMPFTVYLFIDYGDGRHSTLWMCSSPINSGTCRSFWFVCRDWDKENTDKVHYDFQDQILGEDHPVIESQYPPEIPEPGQEITLKTDKVSLYYRRWLHDLSDAAASGSKELMSCLTSTKTEADSETKIAENQ